MSEREHLAAKRRLSKVGEAAIAARMTTQEIEQDPAVALKIAMDAMRAALGLPKPQDTPDHG